MMNDTNFTKIETSRLILDALTSDDVAAVFGFAGDDAVAGKCLMPYPYVIEDAENWVADCIVQNASGKKSLTWAIRNKEDNALIGAIGLQIDRQNSNAELGYWIAKDFQNQQFGREALDAVVAFAFDTCEFNRLWANVFTNNYPSITILEWSGFQPEGRMREHKYHQFDKSFRDILIYGMLKRDYDKRKPQ